VELTPRDRQMVEDIALHHVMTRDQIISLGYFTSISRANRRLLTLLKSGLLERVAVNASAEPRQALYRASKRVREHFDSRVVALLSSRRISPMQLDHSLAVVDTRIKLRALGMTGWLSEPQCRHRYVVSQGSVRRTEDVRPDGLARFDKRYLFIEVDRGSVSLPRIKAKLVAYGVYSRSGMMSETYGPIQPAILFVTTGLLRKRNLVGSIPDGFPMRVFVHTGLSFQACSSVTELSR